MLKRAGHNEKKTQGEKKTQRKHFSVVGGERLISLPPPMRAHIPSPQYTCTPDGQYNS